MDFCPFLPRHGFRSFPLFHQLLDSSLFSLPHCLPDFALFFSLPHSCSSYSICSSIPLRFSTPSSSFLLPPSPSILLPYRPLLSFTLLVSLLPLPAVLPLSGSTISSCHSLYVPLRLLRFVFIPPSAPLFLHYPFSLLFLASSLPQPPPCLAVPPFTYSFFHLTAASHILVLRPPSFPPRPSPSTFHCASTPLPITPFASCPLPPFSPPLFSFLISSSPALFPSFINASLLHTFLLIPSPPSFALSLQYPLLPPHVPSNTLSSLPPPFSFLSHTFLSFLSLLSLLRNTCSPPCLLPQNSHQTQPSARTSQHYTTPSLNRTFCASWSLIRLLSWITLLSV